MTAWTLVSTFVLGFALGMFGLFALVLYFIHLDDKSTALKKAAREYASLYDVSFETALQIIKHHQ